MALILSFLLSSGSKNKEPRFICLSEAKASLRFKTWIPSPPQTQKGTQIYYSFPSKAPTIVPPLGSPKGALYRGRSARRAFRISHKYLIFPTKGALPEAPSMESSKGGNKSPFIQSTKSPANKSSCRFPKRSLYERRCPSLEPFLLSKSPVDEPYHRFPKSEALCRETPVSRDFPKYPSGSPGGRPPPYRYHYTRHMPHQSLWYYCTCVVIVGRNRRKLWYASGRLQTLFKWRWNTVK